MKNNLKKLLITALLGGLALNCSRETKQKNAVIAVPTEYASIYCKINYGGYVVKQDKDFDGDGKKDLYFVCKDGTIFVSFSSKPQQNLYFKFNK